MRVDEALSQVRALQCQLARIERQYCCYRSATIATSGGLAVGAAVLQSHWIPRPLDDLATYLALWVGVASSSVALTGSEIWMRWWRTASPHARQQTLAALRQFVPCIIAGAAATWMIKAFCPEHAPILPAMWSIIFGLGVFGSVQYLPAGSVAVAVYYLLAGLACLRWGHAEQALQPWTMVVTFAVGQWLAAAVLYYRGERIDEIA